MSRAAAPLLLATVLLGGIALELWPEHEDESGMIGSPSRLSAMPPGSAVPSASVPREALAAILARPLFAPDRRPAAAGPAARETLPRLTGIIVDRQRRTAVFEAADGGRPVVLAEDGRIAGFVVRRIEPGEVTLDGPGGTRSLRPTFDPAPRPAASPGPGLAPGISPNTGLSSVAFPNLPSAQPVAR